MEEVNGMRRSTAEMAKRIESVHRLHPPQGPRRNYCRPDILQSLPIHRAAELASIDHCPLRR